MTNLLLTALMLLSSWHATGTEHKITWYWPSEDGWGTAVADQSLMAHGPLPYSSWSWPIVAVSPDLLDDYPYGTWLYVSGEGLKRVGDRTASWVTNTIDIRVPERHMDMREGVMVWVIWRQQ